MQEEIIEMEDIKSEDETFKRLKGISVDEAIALCITEDPIHLWMSGTEMRNAYDPILKKYNWSVTKILQYLGDQQKGK
jgi:hypothetical protein